MSDPLFTHSLLFFGVFFSALVIRLPVFLAIGLTTSIYSIVFPVLPPVVLIQLLNQGLDKAPFSAIPLFFLLGAIMNAGGMTARLVRLANALLGQFQGGLAHVNIGSSMLFGGISGSAVADVSAVGSVMIPAMKSAGYSPAYAAAVTAASAPIGLLIPPSIPMVLFALFNDAALDELFVAGVVPGLMMGCYLIAVSAIIAKKRGYESGPWLGWTEVWFAFRGSVLAIILPVAMIGAMVTGVAAVSEIGALSVVYAALVSTVVYRDVTLVKLGRTVMKCAIDSARILAIIAVSGGSIWIFASLGAEQALTQALSSLALTPVQLLGLVATGLIVSGTVIGMGLQMILIVPMVTPLLLEAGLDILQIGVVTVLASALGLVTPPVGILIFMTSTQSGADVWQVTRQLLPFIVALVLLVAALVHYPTLSTGLGLALGV